MVQTILTVRTPEKEAAVLEALREKPVFAYAWRRARISKESFYAWKRDDAAFAERVKAAREEGLDALEDALNTRALKDDTTAAIFMLKSHRRDVYGDKIDHTHHALVTFAPDWIAVREAIYDALEHYPEALTAVRDRIRALGAGDG